MFKYLRTIVLSVRQADNRGMSQQIYWQQDAKVLVQMKRFQKAIAKLRVAHNIPAEGLPDSERTRWVANHTKGLEATRTKHGKLSDYELLPQDPRFIADLEELAAEFNLGTSWLLPLSLYIIGNGSLGLPYAPLPQIHPTFNDVRLAPDQQVVTRLMIEVRKDSTRGDIEALWPQIEEYQAYMEGRNIKKRRPIEAKTVARYTKIRKLEKTTSHAEIATKLGMDTAKDVSELKRGVEARFKPPKSGSKAQNKPRLFFHP